MPIDPKNYTWLDEMPQPLPRMVVEARKLVGTHEAPGAVNNPVIIGWAKEVGGPVAAAYTADSVPWCGLFMAVVARRAGKTPPNDPLWALNWGNFGAAAGQPVLGDVLTFIRQGGGHVALYIGEDRDYFHVIGGNQSDQVCYDRIDKSRLHAARRTPYMAAPAAAKPYVLAATGSVSTREA